MYVQLLLGYGFVFVLFVGYLVYLQRKLGKLEAQLEDLTR